MNNDRIALHKQLLGKYAGVHYWRSSSDEEKALVTEELLESTSYLEEHDMLVRLSLNHISITISYLLNTINKRKEQSRGTDTRNTQQA